MAGLTSGFNESSLSAAIERVSSIDVIEEPLLINIGSAGDGDITVHQQTSFFEFDRKWDAVVSYDYKAFKDEFGDKDLMTYEQYKTDYKTLSDHRMDLNKLLGHDKGELLRSQFMYMGDRIKEIDRDITDYNSDLKDDPEAPASLLLKPSA